MRLRPKFLVFLALTVLLPLGTYGAYATWSAMEGTQRGVAEGAAAAASQTAGRVGAFLRGRVDVVRALAAALPFDGRPNRPDLVPMLRRALLEDATLRYLVGYDASGTIRVSTLLPKGGASALVRRAARDAVAKNAPVTTEVIIGDDLLPVMAVAVPIVRLGRPVGALSAEIDTLELWSSIRQMRLGRTGYSYVVDREGRLFAHGRASELAYAIRGAPYPLPPVVAGLGTQPVSATWTRPDGTRVVGAAAPVAGTDWVVLVETPAAEAFAGARRLGLALAIILLFGLAIAGSLAWFGARSLLVPVERLAQAVHRVGEGDFGVRVPEGRCDEVGDLARGFNLMTEDLGLLTTEIRRQERLAFFGRIASGLAHDLKRPFQHLVTQMRTFLELPDATRARETLERSLDREQAYIDRLFSDLADFANPQPPERSLLDVPHLVRRVAEGLAAPAADAGVEMLVEVHGASDPRYRLDALALERVVRNLLENAFDALRRRGGWVRLAVEIAPEEVALVFEDDGPGLPAAFLPELFDAFRTTKGSGRGLGLGLAVVRRVVEEHGGRVHAENRPEGGARFVLHLPRVDDADGEASAA